MTTAYHICPESCRWPVRYRVTLHASSGHVKVVESCSDHGGLILAYANGFAAGEEIPVLIEMLP